jgi:tetratricopeptide (TPR) repeat protein
VLELASTARDAGQSMKAIEKLTALLESGPGDWRLEALQMRSNLWNSVGDPEAAVEDLEEAFRTDASLAPVLEKALGVLRKSAATSGDVEGERKVLMRLVDLRVGQKRREDARELMAGWVKAHSSDLVMMRQLRDFDIDGENWEGVAKTCKRLADFEEGAAKINAVLDMTHAYVQLGKGKEARKRLESVYKDNPDSTDVREALKNLYEALGVKEELARMIQEEAEAAKDKDEKVELLRKAASLLLAAGRAGQGVEVLESLLKLKPGDVEVATGLADALMDRYEYERAGSIIDDVLSKTKGRTPALSLLLFRRAKIAGEAKDYELQLKHLEQAFKINRRHGEIITEVANVAEKMGNFELAQQALRNVHLADGPCGITKVDSLLRQARLAMMQGDNKGALLCARKALKEDPESDEATNLIAELM